MDRSFSSIAAEAAADWDARLRAPDCDDADRADFAAWRGAHPENREAFEQLQAVITTLRSELSRPDLRAIRDAALSGRSSGQPSKRRYWPRVAVALAVLSLGIGVFYQQTSNVPLLTGIAALTSGSQLGVKSYGTSVGERSTTTLADGSVVELNADTLIDVRFTADRREIKLVKGQALFQVSKDPLRPFLVRAGDREIVALGTAFDVRLDKNSVRVTLIEGRVAVAQTAVSAEAAKNNKNVPAKELEPGQQLVAVAGAGAVVHSIDVAKATGWRNGRIFLEDLSLADAVIEMNRHSLVQIIIEDPGLERLRVNGMFKAGEQEAFVAALEDYFPIDSIHGNDLKIFLVARH